MQLPVLNGCCCCESDTRDQNKRSKPNLLCCGAGGLHLEWGCTGPHKSIADCYVDSEVFQKGLFHNWIFPDRQQMTDLWTHKIKWALRHHSAPLLFVSFFALFLLLQFPIIFGEAKPSSRVVLHICFFFFLNSLASLVSRYTLIFSFWVSFDGYLRNFFFLLG